MKKRLNPVWTTELDAITAACCKLLGTVKAQTPSTEVKRCKTEMVKWLIHSYICNAIQKWCISDSAKLMKAKLHQPSWNLYSAIRFRIQSSILQNFRRIFLRKQCRLSRKLLTLKSLTYQKNFQRILHQTKQQYVTVFFSLLNKFKNKS